jgi:MFS family permease
VFVLLSALAATGYGVMFTMLDDFREDYGISATALGAVVAIGFFSAFFAQVVLAPRADRGHARRLVFVGMLMNVAGLVVMAFGTTALALLIGRFVMGVGIGMATPAIRRIAVLAAPDDIGGNLGMLLSADVAGFAMGPAIAAALVGPFGIAAPFLVIAAAILACLPVLARVHVTEGAADSAAEHRFAFDLLRVRPYAAGVLLGSAVYLMIGTFDALWALVLADLESPVWISNIGITLFAIPLVVFGRPGGRLAQRVGPFRLATLGLSLAAVFMFSYGHLPTAGLMFAVAMIHGVSDGVTVASTSIAVGMVVPAERQAAAHGLLGGIETLVAGVTALLAGWLYETYGRGAAYGACAAGMVLCIAGSRVLVGGSWRMSGAQPSASDVAVVA